MEPVREHRPPPPEHAPHGMRDADRHRLHPAREDARVLRLDDQVQVIALDRVVHDPEPGPAAQRPKGLLDASYEPRLPEPRHPAPHAQRHVTWLVPREPLARPMEHAWPRPGPSPRTLAATAPPRNRLEFELELGRRARHAT